MGKKEFEAGEVFQFGLKKLKVVERNEENKFACSDCALYDSDCFDLNDFTGLCNKESRTDGKDIVFVEVEEEQ